MTKLSMILVVVALGCGGSKSAPSTPATGGGGDMSMASGGGGGVECAKEVALQCAAGKDGCLDGKTLVHVCVADDATGSVPCAQEVALECPQGQVDGCLKTPAVSANHLCVYE